MNKLALLQVADTGPLESLVVMLRSVGYDCVLPDPDLRRKLKSIGCDTVLDIDSLVAGLGYEYPMPLQTVGIDAIPEVSLFVDIKAHRNHSRLVREWPHLQGKILYYRINGCEPEITAHGGDEVNLPCPILTPNLWYGEPGPWQDTGSFACWPPFYRFDDYNRQRNVTLPPICLIHNVEGWGYKALISEMQRMGVRIHGGGCPDGLIKHQYIPATLSSSRCMIHLKSSDSPGYALYEALAAACPVVIPRRLIWRSKMESLFRPGENCLVFDRETHDSLSEQDVKECSREIGEALKQLSCSVENKRIGEAGRQSLKDVMWNVGDQDDVDNLNDFMRTNFG